MPTWLSDPSNGFYLVLFVVMVVTVMLWARNRRRGDLIRAAMAIAALTVLFVCDLLFESPREGSIRTVEQIAKAINEKNWDQLSDGLSDDFNYEKSNKVDFTGRVREAATRYNPRTTAWEFAIPGDLKPSGPGEFLLQFEGKADAIGKPFMAHFVGTFVESPDGRWRLRTFTAYDYIQKRSPMKIPGL